MSDLTAQKGLKEEYYARRILVKIISGVILDDNKKLLNSLLLSYIKTVYRECPELDSKRIYKICVDYLDKHNFR